MPSTTDKASSLTLDALCDLVLDTLQCTEPISREYAMVALADIATFDRKQRDYGPTNIAAFGEVGVLVRVNDNIARLRNMLWDNPNHNPCHEGVEDSWMDLSVYGVIARLCRRKLWPRT